jgi:poly(A) polymerase
MIIDESPGPRKLNLVWPTTEFLKSARIWDRYDPKTMGITLRNLKGSSLPDELGGESRQLKRLQQQASKQLSNHSTPSPKTSPIDVPIKQSRILNDLVDSK